MSYSTEQREGYTKLANIKQGGGQHVEIYVPDTRRKMSPEAQARALARAEIKEQYKSAALAEEVKAIKKQRNKLVDNLAKVGKSPSFVADIPSVDGLSGTPKTYVDTPTSPTTTTASTPSTSKSQVGNLNYQVGNLNYSAPIGPLPSSSMGGFKNKPYDNRINYSQPIGPTQGPGLGMSFNRNRNYSAPIGPLPSSSMGGFQDRPYNPQMNYSQPIGPTQGPGLGMSFNRSRNYSAPIGPAPSSSMGGFQGRPFNQQTNYSQPIGPTQGPGLGMSFNRNRNYSAPIGPAPSSSMGGFQGRPFNQQTNYSQPIGPTQGPGLGMSFNRNRNYSAPIGPAPGPDMGGFQDRPYNQQINYSQPIGPQGAPNNRRMSGRTPSPSGRMVEYQGRNQQGSYNDYVDDGDQPRRSGLPSSGRVVEYKDDAKTGSVSQQDTSKWTPEMLLPGKTLAEVEAVYKQRKASAVKKGRTKLARALDRAIVIRRKQFGASGKIPQTTPGRTPDRSPTGQTPLPTDVEKNAELLLPGKTEQAVRRVHAERRAAAMKKGNKELVARLDRALPVRLQRLKSQGANVFKVSPERLLPGKTLAEVEAAYKQRRAAAGAKGRTSLVKALDRAIVERRKQFGASPGKTPQTTPVKSPTGKTPLPSDVERNAERLLPGKTEQAVRKVHAERRAAAVKKGNKELVARLDRALPVRLQRLKSQGANVFKVSPERLLPGKTLPEVEAAYKQRRASAVSKGRTALVQALDRAIALRRKQLGGPPGKTPQATSGKSPSNLSKIPPERLIPGKNLAEVEATYKKRRASAVAKKRIALVQALDRAIGIRRKQFGGPSGQVPTSPGQVPTSPGKVPTSPSKTPLPSGKEWKDVFGPVDMSNPNPRAVSEKYQALRRRTKDEDVSKLNALFKKAIIDIKLIKRQRAAQESKSAEGAKAKMEADKARVEAEKAKAKSAEVKKSIDREIISTKRKIRDVSIKAKKASANIVRAGKEISAATARRDTRKAEKLTRFSRKRQQNLSSARQTRERLITSLKGLEQKSAKVSPLMLTQGSPNPMARQSAPQQSSQVQAKAQRFLAEKARAQSAKIEQSGKQLVIKAAQDKIQSAKAQSAKIEQEKKQQMQKAQSAKAQSAKIEQEKKQQMQKARSAKIEQEKKQQMQKAQSAKIEQAKRQQIERARTSQKRQMSQARPQKTMMRSKRR